MGSLCLRILEIYSLFGLVLVANGRIVLITINSITMENKEGVLFHHTIQGDYLPCYSPEYLTENDLWGTR
jgi:hypothetical protein